jgi:hypothetical protein
MLRKIPWQDVCKFLAGAFFMNAIILFYVYLYKGTVPVFSLSLPETPELSGARSIFHSMLFLVFFYLGFVRKWNREPPGRPRNL